ncbi:CaiB/BaiF CoA transferase family protein [Ammoniphilus resinae]|uniref:Crotonobetainyl-CoA:carnitine CoA-transferase CaiB-like acyl-CoA transferase n=1 Tax=Ammoniphilus resinae TaxID=861532 RepID=A0ABS4GKZ1_9BACL|nr:CaiB/BaiF CoA-transferase family protein [Ammoniphilus resinae]MBP1930935.1 crotonobetainyl-CoA:carnitine CoA-transferase CaiB-like acyl-CoA transferase [Ammoniphilus resinae]
MLLKNYKVLSFTHFLQGPSAVQMLADLGADVIKVESLNGAFERNWSGLNAFIDDVSVFFLLGNRNQRSLSVDLRSEQGKEIIYRLVKETDVIVENFRPGVMDRLGLGYETLKEINPRLVYCSCTGYGSDGPYRDRPGQDLLIQALSGITRMNGRKTDPPTPVGYATVDQHSAALSAFGILAALLDREKTGQGHKVDASLLNAALDIQIEPLNYFLNMGHLWDRGENGLNTHHEAPYGIYQTLDGWIGISLNPIPRLLQVFENSGLENYSIEDQSLKREEINRIMVEEVKKRKTEDWFKIFQEAGIWHAPVNSYEDVQTDPQVQWNNMISTIQHPRIGDLRLLSHPLRYDGQTPEIKKAPPELGEHTKQILLEYGYSEKEVEELLHTNVVRAYQE